MLTLWPAPSAPRLRPMSSAPARHRATAVPLRPTEPSLHRPRRNAERRQPHLFHPSHPSLLRAPASGASGAGRRAAAQPGRWPVAAAQGRVRARGGSAAPPGRRWVRVRVRARGPTGRVAAGRRRAAGRWAQGRRRPARGSRARPGLQWSQGPRCRPHSGRPEPPRPPPPEPQPGAVPWAAGRTWAPRDRAPAGAAPRPEASRPAEQARA